MRALLQRVRRASVSVDGEVVGAISTGLLVLVGIARGDTQDEAFYLTDKCVHLRIFPDGDGKCNLSALDVGAEVLAVSQFTLYADTRRGRRPSFTDAAAPEDARVLFEDFVAHLRSAGLAVATGLFQEHMLVALENEGPLTIMLDSAHRHRSRRSGTKS